MKKFLNLNWLLSGLLMTACLFTFTACSDDNDGDGGGDLTPPKYAEDAVKFEIQDADSPYQSIELTPSGDYLVTKNTGSSPAFVKGKKSSVKRNEAGTPSSNSNVINGKYTKNADGSYTLEDFGTITLEENQITIVSGNGQEYKYTVTFAPKVTGVSSDLFRTWKATKYRVQMKGDGYNEDRTFNNIDEVLKWIEEEEGPDSGDEGTWFQPDFSYLIISPYSTLAISCTEYFNYTKIQKIFLPLPWKPTGTNSGCLDPEHVEDGDVITFELKGKNLIFVYDESYDGDIFKMTITYDPE